MCIERIDSARGTTMAGPEPRQDTAVGADGQAKVTSSQRVHELSPQLTDNLAELVSILSVSEVGYPEHTRTELRHAHEHVLPLFRDAGCIECSSIELEDTPPIVTGGIEAPPGASRDGRFDGCSTTELGDFVHVGATPTRKLPGLSRGANGSMDRSVRASQSESANQTATT